MRYVPSQLPHKSQFEVQRIIEVPFYFFQVPLDFFFLSVLPFSGALREFHPHEQTPTPPPTLQPRCGLMGIKGVEAGIQIEVPQFFSLNHPISTISQKAP